MTGCKAQLNVGHAANLDGTTLHDEKRTSTSADSNRVLRRRCAISQWGVLRFVQRTVAYIARPQKLDLKKNEPLGVRLCSNLRRHSYTEAEAFSAFRFRDHCKNYSTPAMPPAGPPHRFNLPQRVIHLKRLAASRSRRQVCCTTHPASAPPHVRGHQYRSRSTSTSSSSLPVQCNAHTQSLSTYTHFKPTVGNPEHAAHSQALHIPESVQRSTSSSKAPTKQTTLRCRKLPSDFSQTPCLNLRACGVQVLAELRQKEAVCPLTSLQLIWSQPPLQMTSQGLLVLS